MCITFLRHCYCGKGFRITTCFQTVVGVSMEMLLEETKRKERKQKQIIFNVEIIDRGFNLINLISIDVCSVLLKSQSIRRLSAIV